MPAARAALQSLRTSALQFSGKGTAEFYLLMSPDKVEQVKFIKGDDDLKSFTETLQKSDIRMKFPREAQAQAVRRAILHCGATSPGPCSLEFVPSTDVRSSTRQSSKFNCSEWQNTGRAACDSSSAAFFAIG